MSDTGHLYTLNVFIKKEVITVFFYTTIHEVISLLIEHFVCLTSMPTSQCKEKKTREGQEKKKIRPRMAFSKTTLLTDVSHTR